MEKHGEIRVGTTPPENNEKAAEVRQGGLPALADHLLKRAAEAAEDRMDKSSEKPKS